MNKPTMTLEQEIRILESHLLHADLTTDPELPEALLCEEFEEIGSSGWITGREQVIAWLKTKNRDERWEFTEFSVRILSPDLVLATYRATKAGQVDSVSKGSRRSSIWKRADNKWCMLFHQATRIADA